jgi:hypothetical protein
MRHKHEQERQEPPPRAVVDSEWSVRDPAAERVETKPAPKNGDVCPVCGRRGRPKGHH